MLFDVEEPFAAVIIEDGLDRQNVVDVGTMNVEAWSQGVVECVLAEKKERPKLRSWCSVRPGPPDRSNRSNRRGHRALAIAGEPAKQVNLSSSEPTIPEKIGW